GLRRRHGSCGCGPLSKYRYFVPKPSDPASLERAPGNRGLLASTPTESRHLLRQPKAFWYTRIAQGAYAIRPADKYGAPGKPVAATSSTHRDHARARSP